MYTYIPSLWDFLPVQDLGPFMFHPQIFPVCLHCAWPPWLGIKEIHTNHWTPGKARTSGSGNTWGGGVFDLSLESIWEPYRRMPCSRMKTGQRVFWTKQACAATWPERWYAKGKCQELRPEREGQLDLDASLSSAGDTGLDLSDCEGVMTAQLPLLSGTVLNLFLLARSSHSKSSREPRGESRNSCRN